MRKHIGITVAILGIFTLCFAGSPPFQSLDPGTEENFNVIYNKLSLHRHNNDGSSRLCNSFVIDDSCNVGIGNADFPTGVKLYIEEGTAGTAPAFESTRDTIIIEHGSGGGGITFFGATDSTSGLLFGDKDDIFSGQISYAYATQELVLYNQGNVLTISSNSQVLAENGDGTFPSISFVNDSDTGMFSGGSGDISFVSNAVATVKITPGVFRPSADNAISLGISSRRWTVVYAVNGTIQTSGLRHKKDIRVLEANDVPLPRAIKYKWRSPEAEPERDYIGFAGDDLPLEAHPKKLVAGTTDQWEYDMDNVYTGAVIGVLLANLRQQQGKIEDLEDRLEALESQ